jgi:urease accessory protein
VLREVNTYEFKVWQLIDSGFPSGGFAHSSGLEAAVQHGHVVDAAGVLAFARQSVAQCGRSSLPLVTAAHECPADAAELDELCDVFLSNPIANRASRAQGRALLTAIERAFGGSETASTSARVRADASSGHLAPMFGALFRLLEVELTDTQRAFVYITSRAISSSGVRLGLIGAYEGQTIQAQLAADVDKVVLECGALAARDIAQTAPLIDLFQSTHDRLYSRLFQS